jgi:3-phenylpropionate/trans-cinnamate dioxygenase ferredoxin subunit
MHYITDLKNLEENVPFKARYNGQDIVIYLTKTGIYAVIDDCSHEHYHLSESVAEDDKVECKKHGSVFDLQTGWPLVLPALEPVKTFKVTVTDEKVYISE